MIKESKAQWFLLVLVLVVMLLFPLYVSADTIIASGNCGPINYDGTYVNSEDTYWTLNDAGVLTIDGSGTVCVWADNLDTWKGIHDKVKHVVFKNNVTELSGWLQFAGLPNLETVDFGKISALHGTQTFLGCSKLKEITIPDTILDISGFEGLFFDNSIETIRLGDGIKVFSGISTSSSSSSVKTIVFGKNLEKIGKNAFAKMTSLETIIFTNDCDYNDSAFAGLDGVSIYRQEGTHLTLEEYIGTYSKVKIQSVIDGKTVTRIGDYAFNGNTKLSSVTLPDSVTAIGNYAFYGCSRLSSISLGNNVRTIGKYAFYGCNSLVTIVLPDTLTTIGDRAFWDCHDLKSINIPSSVTSIGSKAFADCDYLTTVNIGTTGSPTGNTVNPTASSAGSYPSEMPDYALRQASNPKTVVIKAQAFQNCKRLKTVTLGTRVKKIGSKAFYNCKALKTIKIKTKKLTASNIGSNAFKGINKKAKLWIPKSKFKAYKKILLKKGVSKKMTFKKLA